MKTSYFNGKCFLLWEGGFRRVRLKSHVQGDDDGTVLVARANSAPHARTLAHLRSNDANVRKSASRRGAVLADHGTEPGFLRLRFFCGTLLHVLMVVVVAVAVAAAVVVGSGPQCVCVCGKGARDRGGSVGSNGRDQQWECCHQWID